MSSLYHSLVNSGGRRHIAHPRKLGAMMALAIASFSLSAISAEWSAEPTVSLRQEYNDNFNLTPTNKQAVWGTILTPSVTFSRKTEVFELAGTAQLGFNRYSGPAFMDSNNRLFALSTRYLNERNTWGVDVTSRRDSTRTTEQATTGIILPRAQRNNLIVTPSWTHALTERVSLRFDYTLSDTKYEDGASVGLVDSKYNVASASVIYQLSDADSLTVSGARSKSTSAGTSESDTNEIRAGLTHSFSETLQMDAQIGLRKTTSKFLEPIFSCDFLGIGSILPVFGSCNYLLFGIFPQSVPADVLYSPQTISARGTSLNLGVTKNFGEIDTFTARLSRDINPTGRGFLVETDHLALSYRRAFSETLSGAINTDLYRTRNPGISNTGSQYFTIAPSLSWRMSEWWNLDAGIQYARATFEAAPTSASSNLMYGTIRYTWPKISVSR